MRGIKLGKVLGFEISIDWSWLLIFILVVFTLARGYYPYHYRSFSAVTNWWLGVISALLLFASVIIHELTHSIVARRYGTEIKGITLFIFGGVSQTADEPKTAGEEFWMAIVGPIASIVLSGIFYVLHNAGISLEWPGPVIALLFYLSWINLLLALFNLVPGFPLDGGRVLRSAIWGVTRDLTRATRYASYIGQGFGYLLMGYGLIYIFLGQLIGGLWFIFIGWFLTGAARSSYQQLIIKQALSGVPVERVMSTDVPKIPADMAIRQFVEEQLLRHEYSCYPVVRGDEVVGVIGAEEVRKTSSESWDILRVSDIAHPIDAAYKIDVHDDAWDALAKLSSEDVCRLVVMEDSHLIGTVGRESLYRLIQTKMQYGV